MQTGSKVIIAGGREFNNFGYLEDELNVLRDGCGIEVVCGEAKGADELGKEYAFRNSFPVASFPANWAEHGKAAGPIRNKEMAEYADILVAFWDGKSRGTKNMIDAALKYNLEVHVFIFSS